MKNINIKELLKTTKGKFITGTLVAGVFIAGIGALTMPPTSDEMYMNYLKLEFTKEGMGSLYLTEFNGKGLWGWLEKKRVQEVYDKMYNNELGKLQEALCKLEVEKIDIKEEFLGNSKSKLVEVTLKNNTGKDVKQVVLKATFKDKYGKVVDTKIKKETLMYPNGYEGQVSIFNSSDKWESVDVEVDKVIYKGE